MSGVRMYTISRRVSSDEEKIIQRLAVVRETTNSTHAISHSGSRIMPAMAKLRIIGMGPTHATKIIRTYVSFC